MAMQLDGFDTQMPISFTQMLNG